MYCKYYANGDYKCNIVEKFGNLGEATGVTVVASGIRKSTGCPECNKCSDKDCEGSWSEWSKCTEGCQGKVSTRTFNIKKHATGKGKKCEAQDGETETKECDCIIEVAQNLLPKPDQIYGYWKCNWDKIERKTKCTFNTDNNPKIGRYAKEGVTKAWDKLHTHTFTEPVTVDKIKLEAKFNDQGWGNFGYGSVFAVGLNGNKRIWIVGLYNPNTRNGKKFYNKWEDKWTYAKKDINLNTYKFNHIENKLIKCQHTYLTRDRMPSENCQVNDSNSKLIDSIEIWHFNRRDGGYYGYVKDVKITTQPVKPLCSTYTCKGNKENDISKIYGNSDGECCKKKSSGKECKPCYCGVKASVDIPNFDISSARANIERLKDDIKSKKRSSLSDDEGFGHVEDAGFGHVEDAGFGHVEVVGIGESLDPKLKAKLADAKEDFIMHKYNQ